MNRTPLQVLDLFSGIGGFSLGLERTGGFRTAAFCEVAPFPRRVLAHHWPKVPIYDDIRSLTGTRLAADGIGVDVICGGFPCQDISMAGRGAGLSGERSGLWWEFHRLIGEVRPAFVIAENVAALRARGLDDVLGSLAALGYDAEWHCIPASAVGAPHRRDRVWIIAHPASAGPHAGALPGLHQEEACGRARDGEPQRLRGARAPGPLAHPDDEHLAHADGEGSQDRHGGQGGPSGEAWRLESCRLGCEISGPIVCPASLVAAAADGWCPEPNVGRVANGVPFRVDRLTSLGNAVVPQIPELIGRAILAHLAAAPMELPRAA